MQYIAKALSSPPNIQDNSLVKTISNITMNSSTVTIVTVASVAAVVGLSLLTSYKSNLRLAETCAEYTSKLEKLYAENDRKMREERNELIHLIRDMTIQKQPQPSSESST